MDAMFTRAARKRTENNKKKTVPIYKNVTFWHSLCRVTLNISV